MGIMDRFRRDPAPRANGPVDNGHHTKKSHGRHSHDKGHPTHHYTMASRPTFGQWLKHTWLDILTMVCMGAIGLGVYMAKPAANRSFPVTFSDGEIVYPQFAYPMRKEIIPIVAAAVMAALIPIAIILLMQIRVRSFWDVNNGILGLLYGLISAAVFQVFVKWLIGGLRPHFLDVCKPDISRLSQQNKDIYDATGYLSIMYTKDICTGDENEIDDSLESMPSGHTTAAFAGFVYLYLYLNAKLKVYSNYHPSMWKLIVLYIPILGACLIGGSLSIDEFHNWYDILAGAIIGTVFAFSAYRMVYASVWDWRFNHIPLHRNMPCMYNGSDDLSDAVWTHKAGWGEHGGAGGMMGGQQGMRGGHNGASGGHHGYEGQNTVGGYDNTSAGYGNGHHAHGGHGHHGGVNRVPVGGRRSQDIV